jgi:CubicO group peptidase (beta-lactamase class C family)
VAFGLLLAERAAGKRQPPLDLDTRVYTADWLPEGLPPSDPRKSAITLRQLLMMSSGIASHNDGRESGLAHREARGRAREQVHLLEPGREPPGHDPPSRER